MNRWFPMSVLVQDVVLKTVTQLLGESMESIAAFLHWPVRVHVLFNPSTSFQETAVSHPVLLIWSHWINMKSFGFHTICRK